MGTGWRRAFCTSIRRDPEANYLDDRQQAHHQRQHPPQNSPPPRSCVKLGIFSSSSGGSNPSTPRLQAAASSSSTPRLRCRTKPSDQGKALPGGGGGSGTTTPPPSAPASARASPKLLLENFSNPSSSSPRSPSAFALLKATLRLSRSRCGICAQSVRSSSSGRKTAVFTAECSHAFHFPCISAHVRTQGCLSCPVCSAAWHQVPLLSSAAAATPKQAQHEEASREPAGQHPHKRRSGGGEPPKSPHGTGSKIYDDDEPLMPSTPGGGRGGAMQLHFNPIPEEEDGECDHEGNGCSIPVQGRDGALEVAVKPESVALVGTGRSHYNYVVALKVKAPSLLPPRQRNSDKSPARIAAGAPPNLLDPSRRAPIDLVTVLDVSESMSKEKLQMLKKAMRLVVSSLGPADRLSIVAFAATAAKRLLPLRRMSRQGQRAACQIVDRLVMCNDSGRSHRASSCVGSALRKATKVLEDRRERNPVATIMLFSDGHGQGQQQQQQLGEEDPRSQPSAATRFTHLEIPINASASQQQQQQKQPVHGAVHEEAEEDDAFAKCVKGLVSVVLQDVHLQLVFPSGVISSVYSYNNNNGGRGILRPVAHGEGGNSVPLGDLYAEEERELLVELRIPAAAVSVEGGCLTLSVRCSFRDPATREVIIGRNYPLVVQLPPPELQLQSPRPRLLRSSSLTSIKSSAQQQLRDQFIATRAMAESCRLVDLNDLETAVHLLSSARALLMQHQYSASMSSRKKLVLALEAELSDLQLRRSQPLSMSNNRRNEAVPAEARGGEPLTPTSAWRAAEQLAKVAIMRKSLNRVSDLHGLEDARF